MICVFIYWTRSCGYALHLPNVGFGAAGPLQLVLHQVGVVGGGDEVMVEGLTHVLV